VCRESCIHMRNKNDVALKTNTPYFMAKKTERN